MPLDFVRLAKDRRIPILESGHHHCHEGWVQTHCPQCSGGRSGWHLGINIQFGNFNCWRCGKIPQSQALASILRISRSEAITLIREYGGGRGPRRSPAKARPKTIQPPRGLEDLHRSHWRYLESRGFGDRTVVETWGIQGTRFLADPPWRWRLVFPIRGQGGDTLAWLGRSIQEGVQPKYRMTAEQLCRGDPRAFLYGIDLVEGDSVIIVEGPTDAWKMGPGAVATLGVDWKRPQANILRRFRKRFILYDPEPQAQRKAQELAEWLALFPGHTEIIDGLPSDPGALSVKEAKRIRREIRV